MSSRKRPARHDPNDPMHWTKEQYVTHLKSMGITVKSTWRLDMIRQLYFVNQKDVASSTESGQNGSMESSIRNIDEVTVAADDQPNVDTDQPVNENNTMSRTADMLKDSTSALKSANEAMSAMSSMVVGLLANKDASSNSSLQNLKSNYDFASAYQATYGHITPISSVNAEQTFQRQVDTSKGIVFAEDLPKMEQILEGLTVELSAPKDPRLEKTLTLDEFNKAFRKFRNIICKVYPQRRDELDQYEADINDIAYNYGQRFYKYHKLFSAKAATAIIEHNIAINWGKVDDRLLHLVMNGLQSRECELCGDYDHATKFCQKQVYQETPPCAPQATTNGRVVDKSKDRHGRNIIQAEGHDLCNNFNYGTCKWKECKFTHACLKCKSRGHGFKTCGNNKDTSTSNQNKTADKPNVKTSRYRVSPIGIVEGKYSGKKRLIVDLSSPHESQDHFSINDLIDKEQCSLSYVKIDDAINAIKEFGRLSILNKADIADAFKQLGIKRDQHHLYCIKWRNLYYYYERLCFGSRSSPKIFDNLSVAICWIAKNNYNIPVILHLLDDFLTVQASDTSGDRTMALITLIFNRLNIPLSKKKTVGPHTTLEYLEW
ncbi:unnamed protein product [Mytilus edulis]|uniref:Reverse transcriptase domain-containing protein n=1 Tax=Mytilus edulis TaxID=6550 RepID=A0A8S3V140_MYTED|nr:unnamed protein product [Mytilus edulis]